MSGVCDLCESVACICPVPDQPPVGQADRERALLAAGNEMARVIDQEIMPRYVELFQSAGLGAASLSVAVDDATRVLVRWRKAAGMGEG